MIQFDEVFIERCANDVDGPVHSRCGRGWSPSRARMRLSFRPRTPRSATTSTRCPTGRGLQPSTALARKANRLEPLFKASGDGASERPLTDLVPQVTVSYGEEGGSVSLLDAGHRLGDALVRSTSLASEVNAAFRAYQEAGDAGPIAKLAPTSLVFGAWDSRDTQAKLPRILQSVIRAWHVDPLTRSAQYTPPVDYAALEVFSEEQQKKQEGSAKSQLAQRGFVHVPAIKQHGGVVVRGEIRRDVTVNLVALRHLHGDEESVLRRYVLGLAVAAATAPLDGFLRQGCLLTPDPESPSTWETVERSGARDRLALTADHALAFATEAAKASASAPIGRLHSTRSSPGSTPRRRPEHPCRACSV